MNGYMTELYQQAAREIHALYADRFAYHGGRWWVLVEGENGAWIWTRERARERLSEAVAAFGTQMDERASTGLLKRNLTTPWGRAHVISPACDLFTWPQGLPGPTPGEPAPVPPAPAAGN